MYDQALPALTTRQFYALLALARGPAHGYAIGAIAVNDSKGAVKMSNGVVYPLLASLFDQGYIAIASHEPGKRPGQTRVAYQLTQAGEALLRTEIKRLQYATTIAEAANLTDL